MLFNHLILCHLLLLHLLLLLSILPNIRVFSNELALHIRWPKYWSFSISPSDGYSGLIYCRIDWLDLLTVQKTLRSLLQHHSSKESTFWCSIFFKVQASHPHMTTGKTLALTRWTFVREVMSLVFNLLSRLVRTFLLRSKCLLISWLQSPPAVILEPKERRSITVSIVSLFSIKWWDQMPWSSLFECWVSSQLFHSPLLLSSRDSLADCVSQNKLENSSRDGKTRPPYMPPEKSVCRSRSNTENWT